MSNSASCSTSHATTGAKSACVASIRLRDARECRGAHQGATPPWLCGRQNAISRTVILQQCVQGHHVQQQLTSVVQARGGAQFLEGDARYNVEGKGGRQAFNG